MTSRPSYGNTLHPGSRDADPHRNPWVKYGTLGAAALLAVGGAVSVSPQAIEAGKQFRDWATYAEPVGDPVTVSVDSKGTIAAVNHGLEEIHTAVDNDGVASNDFDPTKISGIIEAGQRIEDQTKEPTRPGTKIVVSVVNPRFGSQRVEAELAPSANG